MEKLYLELKDGIVAIELYSDVAPKHVEQIKFLARSHFYDGLLWHRVIDGFMAQTGCPNGDGTGGFATKLNAEFSNKPHKKGTVSMARTNDPNSASSQFFICFADSPFLNEKYTVWGQVIDGMEFVDNIKKGDAKQNGKVENPDKIVRMWVGEPLIKLV